MTGLIIKLIVCPLIVGFASVLLPNVHYVNFIQPIIVGLVLAIAAHLMEVFLLREKTLTFSTVLDFAAAILIVYFVSMFLPGAEVTFFGAVITGFMLTLSEIPQHSYLVRSGKAKKSPA